MTPATSAAERFWLILALASMREIGISNPEGELIQNALDEVGVSELEGCGNVHFSLKAWSDLAGHSFRHSRLEEDPMGPLPAPQTTGRSAGDGFELAGEEVDVAVAQATGDLIQGPVRFQQQLPGALDAGIDYIASG